LNQAGEKKGKKKSAKNRRIKEAKIILSELEKKGKIGKIW
jgi:hypothetical protein